VNAAVATVVLLALPLPDALARMARDSEAAERLSPGVEWVQAQLAPIFQPAIARSLQALKVPQDDTHSVALRFTVADPKARAELEARMLELVNAERAREGLKPLKADPELAEVARAHSRDMFARGYFSHVSPDGGKLSDRMRKGEVRYLLAGENLALAPTLPVAHQGLMNSPGHRANILRPQFGRVGIGVLDGGRHGLMVTQDFRN
uniref:CAP domain-containing protein n=1 Tax=Ramlibacter sp. TaxID=1917967 RepID=UPI0017FEC816